MTSNRLLRLADRVGCSLSAACAIHCLAAPLVLTFIAASPVAEDLELPMIVIALSIAAATFSAGFVRHTAVMPLVLLLVAGPVMMASRCVHGALVETALLVTGAILLSAGHVMNLRRGHVSPSETPCRDLLPEGRDGAFKPE
jgi:hypothetical protein